MVKKINTSILNPKDDDDSIVINGKFRLIPSEFLIELPSFMLVKMEDFLNINLN